MKEIVRKRNAAKQKREEEEEQRKATERENARNEAHSAWLSWRDMKDVQLRENRAVIKERKAEEKRNAKDPQQGSKAYAEWMKQKGHMYRDNKKLFEQYQLEEERKWHLQNRDSCEKAYRCWLKRKDQEARMMREQEDLLRRESLRLAKQAKKTRRLLNAIREAQEMKYVDYY